MNVFIIFFCELIENDSGYCTCYQMFTTITVQLILTIASKVHHIIIVNNIIVS